MERGSGILVGGVFREVAQLAPAAGVAYLQGMMCLHLWETWLCFLGMIAQVFFGTGL